MIVTRPESLHSNRRAYTLIELVVASFLTIQIGMVLVLTWKAFGVSALQVEERARLTVNANLAVESLARDLSGYQVKIEGRTGPNDPILVYRLYVFVSRSNPDSGHLQLVFNREDKNSVQITITYYVESNSLVRREENSGDPTTATPPTSATTTVATHVTNLLVTPNNVSFTVSYRDFVGTYTLTVSDPS